MRHNSVSQAINKLCKEIKKSEEKRTPLDSSFCASGERKIKWGRGLYAYKTKTSSTEVLNHRRYL